MEAQEEATSLSARAARSRGPGMSIIFGMTPPLPKSCPICKHSQFQWSGEKWQCLNCANPNPCVTKFGPGPQGAVCKDCIHLHGFKQSATWYKCDLRKWKAKSSGTIYSGKDHRVNWPACGRYEKEVGGDTCLISSGPTT